MRPCLRSEDRGAASWRRRWAKTSVSIHSARVQNMQTDSDQDHFGVTSCQWKVDRCLSTRR